MDSHSQRQSTSTTITGVHIYAHLPTHKVTRHSCGEKAGDGYLDHLKYTNEQTNKNHGMTDDHQH
ncbi:hypothetical protein P7K49_023445, partial [Saguinus oedipus]